MQVSLETSLWFVIANQISASDDERDEWSTAIRNAKAALLASLNVIHPNSTLSASASTNHLRRTLQALPHLPEDAEKRPRRGRVEHFVPAVWIPDGKTESCMRCGRSFNWRRRRHHCRLCGRCVCASCSGCVSWSLRGAAYLTKSFRPDVLHCRFRCQRSRKAGACLWCLLRNSISGAHSLRLYQHRVLNADFHFVKFSLLAVHPSSCAHEPTFTAYGNR
jgi:hypothetical protein